MQTIQCAEVWGGIKNQDVDACSRCLNVSLYSSACDGGRGGDVYYLSVCGYDRLTRVAIADVAGHGESVSRISDWLYQCLKERMNDSDGAEVLRDLNHRIVENDSGAITTAAVLGFYVDHDETYYAYAGHPPAYVYNRGNDEWRALQIGRGSAGLTNLPLGVDDTVTFDQAAAPFRSGDRMLLYTDGVLEARSPNGEEFGSQRLYEVLQAARDETLPRLKRRILSELVEFAGGGPLTHDDVTLLAAEMR
ncbi:MAG: serine/threonine-protein phosphatase [Planctomycetota bacterium]|nr:MAG: serine/threonine-protein phosphatase [Planctomycetota bacterium]